MAKREGSLMTYYANPITADDLGDTDGFTEGQTLAALHEAKGLLLKAYFLLEPIASTYAERGLTPPQEGFTSAGFTRMTLALLELAIAEPKDQLLVKAKSLDAWINALGEPDNG